jgi:type II secretory pathway component PulK
MNRRNFNLQRRHLRRGDRRRGIIFITALGIIIVISGMVLIFAQEMRTEAISSANRVSYTQADAIEQGAEQWVVANLEAANTAQAGDAVDIVRLPGEAIQLGNGYFWMIRPLDGDTTQYDYGIVDEGGKLYLNAATTTLENELLAFNFPDMTQDVAASIANWQTTGTPDPNGSDTSYYSGLQEPYNAKHSPFETVDELMLVAGMTPQLLYGYDRNRDGVIDQAESNAGNTVSGTDGLEARGIFPYMTVWNTQPAVPSAQNRNPKPTHLVNVNTASEQVLMALGVQQSDADSIVSYRSSQDATALTNLSWVATAAPAAAAALTNARNPALAKVTTTSYQYSADIVAVSGDGRAFKRVRIVVDLLTSAGATGSAARIAYRKDLTSLGWPLLPEIRTQLRAGQPINVGTTQVTNISSGNLGLNH